MIDTKLTCPKCGSESPFKDFQKSLEIFEIFRLGARFGRNGPWVEEYLFCFRSALDKPLRPARIKILLEEILDMIKAGGFKYDGKQYVVRPNAVFEAIRLVAQTNKTGFKNHNYLKKVAISCNLKMIQGEEKEQTERAREAMKRDPNAPERIENILKTLG